MNALNPDMNILYVEDASRSAAFYAELLQRQPVEASPNFAMFVLGSGLKLGLWGRPTVVPAAQASTAQRSEMAIAVADDATVDACHRQFVERRIPIAQAPEQLDFGYTFVGLDPDGHRLRVFCPGQE